MPPRDVKKQKAAKRQLLSRISARKKLSIPLVSSLQKYHRLSLLSTYFVKWRIKAIRHVRKLGNIHHICHNTECNKPEMEIPHRRCNRCKYVRYCSAECQRRHWSAHKKICNAVVELTSYGYSVDMFKEHRISKWSTYVRDSSIVLSKEQNIRTVELGEMITADRQQHYAVLKNMKDKKYYYKLSDGTCLVVSVIISEL